MVCEDTIKQEILSDNFCGYIKNTTGPFQECIELANDIDPNIVEMFYEDCEYDVCAYWGDADGQVCSSLETFLAYCYDIGAGEINFRTNSFCPRKNIFSFYKCRFIFQNLSRFDKHYRNKTTEVIMHQCAVLSDTYWDGSFCSRYKLGSRSNLGYENEKGNYQTVKENFMV